MRGVLDEADRRLDVANADGIICRFRMFRWLRSKYGLPEIKPSLDALNAVMRLQVADDTGIHGARLAAIRQM